MSEVDHKTYIREIEDWRTEREEALRAPDGWLSLAGLFVLEEGDYTVGSGEANLILLPPSAPHNLGILTFREGQATLRISAKTPVMVDGMPVESALDVVELQDNRNGQRPTIVTVGSVSFNVHKFDDNFALRVRDRAISANAAFAGCGWYGVRPEYNVRGHFTRHGAPTPVRVTTSVNTAAEYQTIGTVDFELEGHRLKLLAAGTSKENELFIIFRDATAGHETYGSGRYLYAEVDEAGNVMLDFNKAYNPPCAFTPYATCSLPPVQNILTVAIEAGELY